MAQAVHPTVLIYYLNRIQKYLKSDKKLQIFPNISDELEQILVNLASEANTLGDSAYDDEVKSAAALVDNLLIANKHVYTLYHDYESGDYGDNVLVYRKCYKQDNTIEPLRKPSICQHRIDDITVESDVTTNFKIRCLNATLKFIKDDSQMTFMYPEMASTQAAFIMSMLSRGKEETTTEHTDIGFGFKSLYSAVWEAMKIFSLKYNYRIEYVTPKHSDMKQVIFEKIPKKSKNNLSTKSTPKTPQSLMSYSSSLTSLSNSLTSSTYSLASSSDNMKTNLASTPDNCPPTPDNCPVTPDNCPPTPDNCPPTPDNCPVTPDNCPPTPDNCPVTPDNMALTINNLTPTVNNLAPSVNNLASTLNNLAPTVNNLAPTVKKLAPTVNNLAPTVNNLASTVNNLASTVNNLAPTVNKLPTTVNNLAPTVNYLAPPVNNVAPTVNNAAPTVKKLAPTVNNLAPTVNKLASNVYNLTLKDSTRNSNAPKNCLTTAALTSTINNTISTSSNSALTSNNLTITVNNSASTSNNLASTANNLASTSNNSTSTTNNSTVTIINLTTSPTQSYKTTDNGTTANNTVDKQTTKLVNKNVLIMMRNMPNIITNVGETYINDSLEKIRNFILREEEASIIFQRLSKAQAKFLRQVRKICKHSGSYMFFSIENQKRLEDIRHWVMSNGDYKIKNTSQKDKYGKSITFLKRAEFSNKTKKTPEPTSSDEDIEYLQEHGFEISNNLTSSKIVKLGKKRLRTIRQAVMSSDTFIYTSLKKIRDFLTTEQQLVIENLTEKETDVLKYVHILCVRKYEYDLYEDGLKTLMDAIRKLLEVYKYFIEVITYYDPNGRQEKRRIIFTKRIRADAVITETPRPRNPSPVTEKRTPRPRDPSPVTEKRSQSVETSSKTKAEPLIFQPNIKPTGNYKSIKEKVKEALLKPVESEKAMKMMKMMGWKGEGLGPREDGIREPVPIQLDLDRRAGLGHVKPPPEEGKIRRDAKGLPIVDLPRDRKREVRIMAMQSILTLVTSDVDKARLLYPPPTIFTKKEYNFLMECVRNFNNRKAMSLAGILLELASTILAQMRNLAGISLQINIVDRETIEIVKTSKTNANPFQMPLTNKNTTKTSIDNKKGIEPPKLYRPYIISEIFNFVKSEDRKKSIYIEERLNKNVIQGIKNLLQKINNGMKFSGTAAEIENFDNIVQEMDRNDYKLNLVIVLPHMHLEKKYCYSDEKNNNNTCKCTQKNDTLCQVKNETNTSSNSKEDSKSISDVNSKRLIDAIDKHATKKLDDINVNTKSNYDTDDIIDLTDDDLNENIRTEPNSNNVDQKVNTDKQKTSVAINTSVSVKEEDKIIIQNVGENSVASKGNEEKSHTKEIHIIDLTDDDLNENIRTEPNSNNVDQKVNTGKQETSAAINTSVSVKEEDKIIIQNVGENSVASKGNEEKIHTKEIHQKQIILEDIKHEKIFAREVNLRKRVHSPNRQEIPTKFKKVGDYKMLYILPKDYPEHKIDNNKAREIQTSITRAIDYTKENLPLLTCQGIQNGCLIYNCQNEKSVCFVEYLINMMEDLKIEYRFDAEQKYDD